MIDPIRYGGFKECFDGWSGYESEEVHVRANHGSVVLSDEASKDEDANVESLFGVALAASLTVNDIERSVAWYRDVLGFAVDQRYEREGRLVAVSLKAGAVRILVGQDDGAKGRDRVKGVGFSLQITTTQDIEALAQRIVDRGGVLESAPVEAPWGVRVFRIRDPDGFRFTISSPPPGA